jgi:uncharacterized SAM-binding protein YcdF (DUF218 family)
MEPDVATRTILKLFVLPPGSLILLLLVGWLLARRPVGRLLILLGIIGLYGLSTPVVVDWLAGRLETIPAPSAEELRNSRADAILVLLAGVRRSNPELDGADALDSLSLERIDHALALHRQTGLPIVVSGGSVKGDTATLAELGADWLQRRTGVTALAVEGASRDTWENAAFSADIMENQGLGRALLVTHAFHMPRAMLSARAAGIDAIPAPFAFLHEPPALRQPREFGDWLPHPGTLGRSYLILHEMAGLVWYGLKGR